MSVPSSKNEAPSFEDCLKVVCGLPPAEAVDSQTASRIARHWALRTAKRLIGRRHGSRGVDADDVVQLFFLQLVQRGVPSFDPQRRSLQSYCETQLRWALLNLYRQTGGIRRGESLETDEPASGMDPWAEAHRRDVRRRLRRGVKAALRSLSPQQRGLVVARYLRGAETKRICEATGLNGRQINSHVYAARQALRPRLRDLWRFYLRNRIDDVQLTRTKNYVRRERPESVPASEPEKQAVKDHCDDCSEDPRKDGDSARLNLPPAAKERTSADDERDRFAGFAARDADGWFREILGVLYARFWSFNRTMFESRLRQPHLMLGMTAPRAVGFCKQLTDYGGQMQITLRQSLFDGTHRGVRKAWHEDAGVQRLVDDVLLHELIHQWQFEVTGAVERSQGGHGKRFTEVCNRLAADHFMDEGIWEDDGNGNVLTPDGTFGPRVAEIPGKSTWRSIVRRRGPADRHKPLSKHWPLSIRPAGYYGKFVSIGGGPPLPEPVHIPAWAQAFENIIAYYEARRMGELIPELRKELRKLYDADCPECGEIWAISWDAPVCRLRMHERRGMPKEWLSQLPKLLRPLDEEEEL